VEETAEVPSLTSLGSRQRQGPVERQVSGVPIGRALKVDCRKDCRMLNSVMTFYKFVLTYIIFSYCC
jgi:hypothetical protein